jgi:hypothetical protein
MDETWLLTWCRLVLLGQMGEKPWKWQLVTDCQGYGTIEDTLLNVMGGWSDVSRVVVIVAVFALLVVCAVFVSVTSGEIEKHVFALLTGQEERFRRMRGWF